MNAPADSRGDGGGRDGYEQGELFEPLPFSPTFPKGTTLKGNALAIPRSGSTLIHPEFQDVTGSWRPSVLIRALRHNYGWPVVTVEIPSPTAEYPDRCIAEYHLPKWVISQTGGAHG